MRTPEQAFDVRTSGAHIVLPALIGARASAVQLADHLPDDLTGREVTIDANLSMAASQGFADELIKQVFEIRNASSLAVSGSSAVFSTHLRRSAAHRRSWNLIWKQSLLRL